MKPKICILYTGGTIGMVAGSNGIIRPPEDPSDFLKVAPQVRSIVDFDFYPVPRADGTVLNNDSIDMVVSDWSSIATAVYERRNDNYAGFVVVHGVDTMAYSASAVALALGPHLNFPVVFVGSQSAATLPHGDGQINLIRACRVAMLQITEVVICFNNRVFRGCCAQKKDDRDFDAFESPGVEPVCVIKDTLDLRNDSSNKIVEATADIELSAHFASGILPVPLTPATPSEMLIPAIESNECCGVILQTAGGGNIPNTKFSSFIRLIERATALGKPVIITSMFPYEPNEFLVYQSGIDARNSGAIQMTGMVFPALVTKLSWVLGGLGASKNSRDYLGKVEKLMKTPYVGEIDPTPGFQGAMQRPSFTTINPECDNC